MNNLKESVCKTEYGNLTYYASGPQEKTVVFLHGLSANHRTWLPCAHAFMDAGFRVIVPDLRGHGGSDQRVEYARYRLSQFAKDLLDILRVEGVSQAIVVGYSFGGMVAQEYAVKHPNTVQGMVLISANHNSPLSYKRMGFLQKPSTALLDLLGYLCSFYMPKNIIQYDPSRAAGYWMSVWLGLRSMPPSINLWMLAEGLRTSIQGLNAISAPVLIVRALTDPFFTAQEARDMEKLFPHARIVELDAGHFLPTEQAETTVQLLKGFATSV